MKKWFSPIEIFALFPLFIQDPWLCYISCDLIENSMTFDWIVFFCFMLIESAVFVSISLLDFFFLFAIVCAMSAWPSYIFRINFTKTKPRFFDSSDKQQETKYQHHFLVIFIYFLSWIVTIDKVFFFFILWSTKIFVLFCFLNIFFNFIGKYSINLNRRARTQTKRWKIETTLKNYEARTTEKSKKTVSVL